MEKIIYLGLDGTLMGRSGSMTGESWTALRICHDNGAQTIPASGSTAGRVVDVIHRFGGERSCVFELGGIMVEGKREYPTVGEWVSENSARTTWHRIQDSGAPGVLLRHFGHAIERHTPWWYGRTMSHCFRGAVDIEDANALLAANGFESLRVVDGGPIGATADTALDVEGLRVIYLVPRGVSMVAGVAAHQQASKYDPEHCYMIGSSAADLAVASTVHTVYIVGNGPRRDPALADAVHGVANAVMVDGEYGTGALEAVRLIFPQ